jgi:hypothetical protein
MAVNITKSFGPYFREIGMSPTAVRRAVEVIELVADMHPPGEEFNVFVSDTIDSDGNRIFPHLWVFSENYASEAKNFMTETNFDMVSIDLRQGYLDVHYRNYSPGNWSEESRISADIRFLSFSMEFFAARNNCERLYRLLKEALATGAWVRS